MNKMTKGFTIIELLVIISVIGVLTTIGIFSFHSIQEQTRDSSRSAKIITISEALENYYSKNGEYPSCAAMSQSVDVIAASVLPGIEASSLTTPSNNNGTNSFITSCNEVPSSTDAFAYIGDGSETCLTGSACTKYALEYWEESTNAIKTVTGRHGTVVNPSAPPAPSTPAISVILNGSDVQATITPATCTTGTVQYGIESRTNNGSWTGYTEWSDTLIATQTANDGVLYGYRTQARCYVNSTHISSIVTSAESTYVDPVSAPVAPTVSTNTIADTTTYSWTTPTCADGTTVRYQYRYTISPVGYDSGLIAVSASPLDFTTSTAGQTYTVTIQAQCYNTNTSSGWGIAGSASHTTIAAPSVPNIAVVLNSTVVEATITPITCAVGITEYGIDYRLNGGSWTGYTEWSTALTASQTANDGVSYGYRAQARCYIDETQISAVSTSMESTYTDPINAPAAPVISASTVGGSTTYSWTTPTCADGTTVRYQYRYTISPSGYDSGLVAVASSPLVLTTSTEEQTYTIAIQAQCYSTSTASDWSTTATTSYYRPVTPVDAPSAPTVAVALNGSNVQATITPVTCAIGTAEYGIDYQLNGDGWTGYTAWSTALIAAQTANDGVLYSYRVQARCYLDASHVSTTTTSSVATYIDPVAVPTAPVVTTNTVADTTTYSWTTPTCADGTTVRYQYRYTISPSGYDSGLIAVASSPLNFTTSTIGQTYTVTIQAQCYNANITSEWSTTGSGSYTNIGGVPTVINPTVASITVNGATLGATVSSDGGSTITSMGICWGTTSNPTTNCQEQTIGIGAFTQSRAGMSSNTTIYYRGYATNSVGTAYSVDGTFNTLSISYALTISASSGGTVNAAVNGTYASGSTVTITATPDSGSSFYQWTGTGCSGLASHTITITAKTTCVARFYVYQLVGSIGSAVQGASGAAVTPAWGTGETRTAGNLLICFVSVYTTTSTTPNAPYGWSTAITKFGTSSFVAIFYKLAAGGDTAPTIPAMTGSTSSAQLAEFSGGSHTSPLDKTGSVNGLTSSIMATSSGVDADYGDLILTVGGVAYSQAAVKVLSNDTNNDTAIVTKNDSISTKSHFAFSYGYGIANTSADFISFGFTTTKVSDASVVIASFKK